MRIKIHTNWYYHHCVCTVTLTKEGRENDRTHTQIRARMNVQTQWCEYVFTYTHNDENWGTHKITPTSLCVYRDVNWRRAREWSYTHTDARENERTHTMMWVRLSVYTQWWELRYTHNDTHIIVCVRLLKKGARMIVHTHRCAREWTYTHNDMSTSSHTHTMMRIKVHTQWNSHHCVCTLTEKERENERSHTMMRARIDVHTHWCESFWHHLELEGKDDDMSLLISPIIRV